jgi:protein-S-isoprenylcysteine O-methyltransferase Ste14
MGRKGEGWVILQFIIFGILVLTARFNYVDLPIWVRYSGGVFLTIGGYLGTSGVIHLGKNLSPFPRPVESGSLITHGIYASVRHPIYSGLILGTLGWTLIISNIIGLIVVVILFVFFDAKSRREEMWLVERYPEYAEYRNRVHKLIPWIY